MWKTRRHGVRAVVLVAELIAVSVVATWPLAANVTVAIPLGTELHATVPLTSLWTLWWNADRVAHLWVGYWNAPIFHPIQGTFAFSETMWLLGAILSPLWAIGMPPALVYNLALFAVLFFNGLSGYHLFRALQMPQWIGGSGAVLLITLPYTAKLLGVLQVIPLFGVSWTLAGFIKFGRDGATRHALMAGAGFIVEYLASQQLAALFAPFAAAAGIIAWGNQKFQPGPALRLVAVGMLVAAVIIFAALPVLEVHAALGLRRPPWVVEALSARFGDFSTRPITALTPFPPPASPSQGDTAGLFPGLVILILAVIGSAVSVLQRTRRAWAMYSTVAAVAA